MKKTYSPKLLVLLRPSTFDTALIEYIDFQSSAMSVVAPDLQLHWFYFPGPLSHSRHAPLFADSIAQVLKRIRSGRAHQIFEYYVIHVEHLRILLSSKNKDLRYIIRHQPIERPIFIDQMANRQPLTFSQIS